MTPLGTIGWLIQGTIALPLIVSPALAQLTPDDTLGSESSQVERGVLVRGDVGDRITGGALRGTHLFHSFLEFNVDEGERVYFANPTGIEAILSRVTGADISDILGTLGVEGEADLFLLNPNGFVFGANAQLDLRGSFVTSTGDRFTFPNSGEFSATQPQAPPLLTVSVPIGLQPGHGNITNAALLSVPAGQHLGLYGAEVMHSGSLVAPGGHVAVGGDRLALLDHSQITVSSATGGGTVLIGGATSSPLLSFSHAAARTYIAPTATINADAIAHGNGGTVVLGSEEITGFYGAITARGGAIGGNGGFVEVSGQQHLIVRGAVDTDAPNGSSGTLLLDPTDIVIADGGGDGASDGNSTFAGNNSGLAGAILSTPLSVVNDTAPITIFESELEGLAGDTNVILQATNTITFEDLDILTFQLGTGSIALIGDADGNGVGAVQMLDRTDLIETNGRDITITAAALSLGDINTFGTVDTVGQLPATAGAIGSQPGVPVQQISGRINTSNDVDLFQLYLPGNSTFSATTVGGTNLDTQLFLFDANSIGVYMNDQASGNQSTLPNENPLTPTQPGVYYLAVNNWDVDAVSPTGEIFPDLPFSGVNPPIGDGGALPLSNWNGTSFGAAGDYTITLTGAEGVNPTFAEAGRSGMITLTATQGDLTAGNLTAAPPLFSGQEGSGADVTLSARGTITTGDINTIGYGLGNGGNIQISGDAVSFVDNFVVSGVFGQGAGGDVQIDGRSIAFTDNAQVLVGTLGSGEGGRLLLNATESIRVEESLLASLTTGAGAGGAIAINAADFMLQDGLVATATVDLIDDEGVTSGMGGSISLAITNSTELIATTPGAIAPIDFLLIQLSSPLTGIGSVTVGSSGDAGAVNLTTGRLTVRGGATIASPSFGQARGGDTTVRASERIDLIGTSSGVGVAPEMILPSRLDAGAYQSGAAGTIRVETPTLHLQDGAVISTGADEDSTGRSGDLTVVADRVELIGVAPNTNVYRSGLLSATAGSEDAGVLQIDTGYLLLQDGAVVLTATIGDGDSNNLIINASEAIEVIGVAPDGLPTGLASGTVGSGSGGNLTLTTPRLSVRDGGTITAATYGAGEGGNLIINSASIDVTGTAANGRRSALEAGSGIEGTSANPLVQSYLDTDPAEATGDSGGLQITTDRLQVSDGATISTATLNSGGGGILQIRANTIDLSNDAQISAATFGSGRAGSIVLEDAASIALTDSSISTAVNQGATGRGGNITLEADSLRLDEAAQITASTAGIGEAGNIRVTATELEARSGGQIRTSTASSSAAGNITVAATQVTLSDPNSGLFASTTADSTGDGGDIRLVGDRLSVGNGAALAVNSQGTGDAGTMQIRADAIHLNRRGSLTAATASSQGGSIDIQASRVRLQNDSQISASTGSGRGGSIALRGLDTLDVLDSEITAAAQLRQGTAGALTIDATTVNLRGTPANQPDRGGLSVRALNGGTAGNLTLRSDELRVEDGAAVSVSSETGQAGRLSITANSIQLDQGRLTAETGSSRLRAGAIVELQGVDLLVMRHESLISAEANGSADGGNITIDNPQGFLIAVPDANAENGSDIVARAFAGQGGEIQITTQGIFGIAERPALDGNETNDIDASSQFGISGSVTINRPDVDPSRGLAELPSDITDASRQIARDCDNNRLGEEASGVFVVTGRGGLPTNPNSSLDNENILTEWVTLEERSQTGEPSAGQPTDEANNPQLIEAEGWIRGTDGQIRLIASCRG